MASTNFSWLGKELNLLLYVFQRQIIILKSYRQNFHNVGGGKIWAASFSSRIQPQPPAISADKMHF